MMLDYFYGQSGELFSYFRIPKALFQDCRFRQLSTDARTLYGILLDRMSLSVKNGWLDEQGRVYIIYTVREVQESLCCAEHKAVKLFRELEDMDLIERKRRGLGRPSLIYVKDFSSGLPKAQVQNCPNSNCFRVLCDYLRLLEHWKTAHAPQPQDAIWHPLFVEALQRISYTEYLLDILLYGEIEEKAALIAAQGKEVLRLEQRISELAAGNAGSGQKDDGHNGTGADTGRNPGNIRGDAERRREEQHPKLPDGVPA